MIAMYVAFIALYISDGHNIILLILGILGLLQFIVPLRLPSESALVWPLRFVVYGVLIAANSSRIAQIDNSAMISQGMDNLGLLAAGEISVRLWRGQSDKISEFPAILFCTGVVFLAACQVRDSPLTRFFAPVLFFLLMVAYPLYKSRPAHRLSTEIGRFAVVSRASLVLVALVSGFVIFQLITTYQPEITVIGDKILNGAGEPTNLDASGISKSPTLGTSFDMGGSTTRMLRLVNYSGDPHLRGMSFDSYDRGAWKPGISERATMAATAINLRSEAIGQRCEATRLVEDDGVVFYPLEALGLDSEQAEDRQADFTEGGPVKFSGSLPLEYTIVLPDSASRQKRGFINLDPNAKEMGRDLTIPREIDPNVGLLAQKIGAGITGPQAKIEAVEDYLLRNNAYSLKANPGPGDPLSSFILGKKSADCEYFGSAAVILLRYLGVPSRFVIGYYAHESDGPRVTVVRGDDAHAWCESWISGQGWVTVDATPGDGRPDKTSSAPPFYVRWQEWLQDRLQVVRDWLSQLSPVQLGLLMGTILVGIGAFIYVRSRIPKRKADLRTGYSVAAVAIRNLADRFSRWLVVRHMPCTDSVTWHEHLTAIVATSYSNAAIPEEISLALGFVENYYALRFGLINGIEPGGEGYDEMVLRLQRQMGELEAIPVNASSSKNTIAVGP